MLLAPKRIQSYGYWRAYKEGLSELRQAREICTAKPGNCDRSLIAFFQMTDVAGRMRNRDLAAEAINAYVNTTVPYDFREYREKGIPRTMVRAISDQNGVCNEQAQLKLAAMDLAGFPPDDVRFVGGDVRGKDGKDIGLHAIVQLYRGGDNWILNNQNSFPDDHKPLTLSAEEANRRFDENSLIEQGFLFTAGQSKVWTDGSNFVPYWSLNNQVAAFYDGPDKAQPLWARAQVEVAPGIKLPITVTESLSYWGDDDAVREIRDLAFATRGIEVKAAPPSALPTHRLGTHDLNRR